MPIVWQIRIYDYLRSNILMLRLICDQWVMMLDKWFVDVKVSEEVSIPAGITFANDNGRAFALSFFLRHSPSWASSRVPATKPTPDNRAVVCKTTSVDSFFNRGCGDNIMFIARLISLRYRVSPRAWAKALRFESRRNHF